MHDLDTGRLTSRQRRGLVISWRPDNRACLRAISKGHSLGCADIQGLSQLFQESIVQYDEAKSAQAVLDDTKP